MRLELGFEVEVRLANATKVAFAEHMSSRAARAFELVVATLVGSLDK